MLRRFLVIGAVLTLVMLFSIDTADAGRLGGAYRGPYGDEVTKTEEDTNTNVGEEKASDTPSTDAGNADDSGGNNSGDGGGAAVGGDTGSNGGDDGDAGTGDDGTGATGDDGSGGGDGAGATPPPTTGTGDGSSGGNDNSGGGAAAPTKPTAGSGAGIGGGGGGTKGPGGNVATIDNKAFWTFWFEHNKEWILAELLKSKASRGNVAPGTAGFYFSGGTGNRSLTPVTDEQKLDQILPALQKAMTDKHSWVRDAAVLAMGKMGTEKVLPFLIGRIEQDPDEDVVEDALLALGLTGEKKALTRLLKVLKVRQSKGNRKAFAALGLALLGNEAAVSELMKEYQLAVKSQDDELASVLAIAIGSFHLDSVVPELSRALKLKKRDMLKVHVCQALGQIGSESSRDMLLRALDDKHADVKAAAVLALSRFPDSKVVDRLLKKHGLGSGLIQVKAYSCVALGRIGRDLPASEVKLRRTISKALLEATEGTKKNIYAAMYAALGLGIMGDESAEGFFKTNLGKKERKKNRPENNSAMAMASGLLEMGSVAPLLREISKGGVDYDFQGYACFALAVMGDDSSKAVITTAMKRNERRKDVLRSGCWALGLLGDGTDLDLLIGFLKKEQDSMKEVRGAAAIAIGLIGDGAAVDALVTAAIGDPVGSNRAFAIAALGCLIDKDPVPRIPQLFENIHYRARSEVVKDAMLNL